jgi:hypothetical protein
MSNHHDQDCITEQQQQNNFETPQFTSLRITTTPPPSPLLKPQPTPSPDDSKSILNRNVSPTSQATTLGEFVELNLSPLTRISSFNSSPISQQSAVSSCVLQSSTSANDLLSTPSQTSTSTATRRKDKTTKGTKSKSTAAAQVKRKTSSSVSPRVTSVPLLYTEPQWMEQLKHDDSDIDDEQLFSNNNNKDCLTTITQANKENHDNDKINRSLLQYEKQEYNESLLSSFMKKRSDNSSTTTSEHSDFDKTTIKVQHMHSAITRPSIEWQINTKDQQFGLRPKYLGGLNPTDQSSGCLSAESQFVYLNARNSEFYKQQVVDPMMTIWLLTKNTSFTLSTANSV